MPVFDLADLCFSSLFAVMAADVEWGKRCLYRSDAADKWTPQRQYRSSVS